jgi:hypothetical protein
MLIVPRLDAGACRLYAVTGVARRLAWLISGIFGVPA